MAYTAKTAKQIRMEGGSLAKKLAAEFALVDAELAAIETEYDKSVALMHGRPTDLSGTAETVIVFVADRAYTISAAYLCYTEASSVNTGVNIKVGKLIVGTDDDDYFVVAVATEASKEAGYRKALTLVKADVAEGDIITLNNAGSKTGAGEVTLQLYLTRA